MFRNQNGFTLTELVAGIALSTLLFAGFTMFLVQFVINFNEIKEFNQLQHDMIHTLKTMRYGYPIKGKSDDFQLIGLLTANKVSIASNGQSMTITPIIPHTGQKHWLRYKLDAKGRILMDGQYNIHFINNQVVFPTSKDIIDKQLKYRITNFTIRNMSTFTLPKISLVKVSIDGVVRFRPRKNNQSREEDEKLNTKKASFETTVFISNFDK